MTNRGSSDGRREDCSHVCSRSSTGRLSVFMRLKHPAGDEGPSLFTSQGIRSRRPLDNSFFITGVASFERRSNVGRFLRERLFRCFMTFMCNPKRSILSLHLLRASFFICSILSKQYLHVLGASAPEDSQTCRQPAGGDDGAGQGAS